jgi:acetoin utilization protein AcuA
MQHNKTFLSESITMKEGKIVLSGPIPPEQLNEYTMHEGLHAFRRPPDQHQALVEIAALPEGRIIAAVIDGIIVGYVTFHYPDEMERWSEQGMVDLIELGAIEVAKPYRSYGIGKRMIELAFEANQLDNCIVFTTEYYWHWDLDGTGLSVWDYRKMMENLMKCVDMVWFATDDPEICSHPANCLMVRVGPDVPLSSVEQFDRIRFHQRFMY